MNNSRAESPGPGVPKKEGPEMKKKFISMVLLFASVSICYRLLSGSSYGRSSALYVGIPALLAIGLSFVPTPRSVTGSILLWTTLGMLAVGVLALEGFICILVALPFFLAIGFIIGIFIDKARAREEVTKTRFSLIAILGILSLEGTHESLSFGRSESVTLKRTIPLSPDVFQKKLAQGPTFNNAEIPLFLRAGFPVPLTSSGGGDREVGTRWSIPFDHGEETPRVLTVEISESTPHSMTLVPIGDDTEIGKWISWERIRWKWNETSDGSTKVELTFQFRRNLDPAFYFGPIQRFGVGQAGEYFLDSIIQP